MSPANANINDAPAWAAWIGIIVVVLGVYLTAAHGTELLKMLLWKGRRL